MGLFASVVHVIGHSNDADSSFDLSHSSFLRRYQGIGIRIEEDVLITEDGAKSGPSSNSGMSKGSGRY